MIGRTLSHYEIVAVLGSGGMGDVYRARDTKLEREVAIKVIAEEFSRDKERLDRFEREAKLLAQLNHANIATLYGFEDADGQRFLVMELVEGETLGERIAKGPIPRGEAITLFIQVAEGLEAAHEKNIVHRDLKPSNIKLGPDGKIKILDFGLAKVFANPEARPEDLSQSPTLTKVTALGAILGTPPYMSPEQARGTSVDKRTDIWAFGCCLYEALSGRAAFLGQTATDTLARILEREPDWSALPSGTPEKLLNLLERCSRKDPRRRLQHIGDARVELEDIRDTPDSVPRRAHATGWSHARCKSWVPTARTPGRSSKLGQRTRSWSWLGRPTVNVSHTARAVQVMGPNGENPRKIVEAGAEDSFVELAWSPDGERLAYSKWHSGPEGEAFSIESIHLESGRTNVALSDPRLWQDWRGILPFSWTPDGRLIYARQELPPNDQSSNLWALPIDLDSGETLGAPARVTQLPGYNFQDLFVTADGHQLSYLLERHQSDIYVGELRDEGATLMNVRRLTLDERSDKPGAWMPDSREVLFHSNRGGSWALWRQGLEETDPEVIASTSEEVYAVVDASGSWILHWSSGDPMRLPVTGGPSERVLTTSWGAADERFRGLRCGRAPGSGCVLGERDTSQTEYIFSPLLPFQWILSRVRPPQFR